ncbi:MAG: circularly permuted type 2 ATP-grasp protein, partial [Alphaproteobacteria bacterium]|nr:circularly permuted type 2 ATP-grasp protein [Alphaproteobacteria bacterium]
MIGGATTERFWSAVQGLGVAEQARRRRRAVELLRRHDVTYNLHGDPEDSRRPWPLDLAPLIIEEGDWAELERGVEQRARVLEALLADLHGPGRVVEAGILSDEAVRGSPYHLAPMRGATVAGGRWLAIYACDVARDGEGRWVAVEDRCQVPSGMGYALENRIVVARTLPELFKDAHIR